MKKTKYCGGIRNLQGLKDRCVVNDENGCWNWSQSVDNGAPKVHLLLTDGRRIVSRGRRAALIVKSGMKQLPPGRIVYAAVGCTSPICVNPDHAKEGDRFDAGAAHCKSGILRGNPVRLAAVYRMAEKRRKLTQEQVDEIRAGDRSDYYYAAQFGVSQFAVWCVRTGKTWRPKAAANSSVFNWRPAA